MTGRSIDEEADRKFIILDDGSRIGVTSRRDENALRNDACTLSEFLGKPLWDATVQNRAHT
jgi:hypothetical protein